MIRVTREEIIKELRCLASGEDCPSEKCDNTCPYWTEIERGAALYDDRQLCRAAADLLEQDAHPADMIPKDYHDRCMEMEIERRILLEQTHKKTVAEVCELRDQVHNLTLYLTEALALCPGDLKVLEDWHPGLPGYASEPEEACAACRVGGEEG